MAELKELVIKGPDPEMDGVVRWRCVDLRAKVAAQLAITFHKRSVAKLLRKLDLTRLQPRPYHPKKDAAAQWAFKKRARIVGPPVAVETGGAILNLRRLSAGEPLARASARDGTVGAAARWRD